MSGIIICKTKTADNPYTFLNTKMSVYTYEELCYYIFNNMVLVGKDDLTDRLTAWLRDEIEMYDLADKVDALNQKNAYIQDVMVEILTFGEFYGTEDIKEFLGECKRIRTLKPYELDKRRADSYMMYKHYIKADAIYDEIIEYKESHDEYDEFLGNIYHNKGVALAGNLQLEEAKECFIRAFSLNKNNESLIEYFCVMAVTVDTATLQREIRKRGTDSRRVFVEDSLRKEEGVGIKRQRIPLAEILKNAQAKGGWNNDLFAVVPKFLPDRTFQFWRRLCRHAAYTGTDSENTWVDDHVRVHGFDHYIPDDSGTYSCQFGDICGATGGWICRCGDCHARMCTPFMYHCNGHSQAVSEIPQAGCSSGDSRRHKTSCCGYDRVSGSFDICDGGLDWYRYDKSRRN